MPRQLQSLRRRPGDNDDDGETILAHLSTGDVLQRLAVLNREKMHAIDFLARVALMDELEQIDQG